LSRTFRLGPGVERHRNPFLLAGILPPIAAGYSREIARIALLLRARFSADLARPCTARIGGRRDAAARVVPGDDLHVADRLGPRTEAVAHLLHLRALLGGEGVALGPHGVRRELVMEPGRGDDRLRIGALHPVERRQQDHGRNEAAAWCAED